MLSSARNGLLHIEGDQRFSSQHAIKEPSLLFLMHNYTKPYFTRLLKSHFEEIVPLYYRILRGLLRTHSIFLSYISLVYTTEPCSDSYFDSTHRIYHLSSSQNLQHDAEAIAPLPFI